MTQEFYHPFQQPKDKRDALESRKEVFAGLNEFVTERSGWLTSVAGAKIVAMECLPDSTLPDDLRALGYRPLPDGLGERILHNAIVHRFSSRADGGLDLMVAGSTMAADHVVTHAGIVTVQRWTFELP
jgi:hypothetical protein